MNGGNSLSQVVAATMITLTYDTTAPAAPTITGGPTGSVDSTSASFTFTHTEPTATFECSMDSTSAYSACTSPGTTRA